MISRPIVISLLLMSWLPHGVQGQGTTFTTVIVDPNFPGVSDVAAADIDGDGLIDVIACSESSGDVRWWKNPGADEVTNTASWVETTIVTAFSDAAALSVGDIDGDGNVDVHVVSPDQDSVVWIENPGGASALLSGQWSRTDILFDGADSTGADDIEAGDVDGDGNLDLLVVSQDGGEVLVFRSPGGTDARSSVNWTVVEVDDTTTGPISIAGGDIDGDGNIDLAVANGETRILWFRNPGGASSLNQALWTETAIGLGLSSSNGVCIADIDGDTNADVASVFRSLGDVIWEANPGGANVTNSTSWSRTTVDGGFPLVERIECGDIDSDGDVDLLAASETQNDIAWYANPGGATASNGASWQRTFIDQNVSDVEGIRLADVDGDGNLDVLASERGFVNDVVLYLNDAAPFDFRITAIGDPVDNGTGFDISLTWTSVGGASYVIETSTDLEMWEELARVDSQGALTTEVVSVPADLRRFFRIVRLP